MKTNVGFICAVHESAAVQKVNLIAAGRSELPFNLLRCSKLLVRGNRCSLIKFGVRSISDNRVKKCVSPQPVLQQLNNSHVCTFYNHVLTNSSYAGIADRLRNLGCDQFPGIPSKIMFPHNLHCSSRNTIMFEHLNRDIQ